MAPASPTTTPDVPESPRSGSTGSPESTGSAESAGSAPGVAHLPRLLAIAWPVALGVCAAEVLVLVTASGFLVRPARAPLSALTILLIAGALVCIPLILLVVWSSVAPGAADRVPSSRGRWTVVLAVGLFVFAIVGTWFAVPSEHPVMIDGVGGVMHGTQLEVLPAAQYNSLVLQQLRFVGVEFVSATGWIVLAVAAQRRRRAGVTPTHPAPAAAPPAVASAPAAAGIGGPDPAPPSSDPGARRRRWWSSPSVLAPRGLVFDRMGAHHS